MNLVLNGAQAMPAGGPLRVEVAARDGRVRLSVADEGTGVDPGLGDRVFEPFVTTKKDGVGLGLALTRRIVEEHGGAIGYDRASKGTVFWIELPHG
jgi:signal transduction histidine kinase